jgi:uncharacterized repeat protein (TIGR03803 family)
MIPFSSTAKLTALCAIVLTASFTVHAQTQTVLYTFTGQPDGATPNGGLVMDAKGNLYGTTFSGGSFGGGTAFKLMPDGKETLLHSFAGGADGMGPGAGLIRAGAKLYGTTAEGGANSFGTVFEVTKIGSEGVLAALSIQDGGGYPEGAPLRDKQGYLYETITGYNGGYGNGAVFKISPSGALSMLYEFKGGVDGLCPYGNLVEDSNGNLYGTTYRGGTSGRGNVYKISPDGTETVLYSFSGGVDGDLPAAGLVRASQLYCQRWLLS